MLFLHNTLFRDSLLPPHWIRAPRHTCSQASPFHLPDTQGIRCRMLISFCPPLGLRDARYLHVAWLLWLMKLLVPMTSRMLCDATVSSVKGASYCLWHHQVKPHLDLCWCCCHREWEMGLAPFSYPLSPTPQANYYQFSSFLCQDRSQRTISPGGYHFLSLFLALSWGLGGAPIWEVGTLLYIVAPHLQWLRCCDWVKFWSLWLSDFPNAPLSSSSRRLWGVSSWVLSMASLHSEKLIRVSVDSKTWTGIVERGRHKWNQVRVGTGVVPSSKERKLEWVTLHS